MAAPPQPAPAAPPVGARRDRLSPVIAGALMASGTLVVALRDPHAGGYGLCPLLALTGWSCPLCGGLRTTHSLATGDLAAAWAANPLLAVALPVVAVLWLAWTVRAWRGLRSMQPPAWLWPAVVGLLVAFGVLRNLPALQPLLGPT